MWRAISKFPILCAPGHRHRLRRPALGRHLLCAAPKATDSKKLICRWGRGLGLYHVHSWESDPKGRRDPGEGRRLGREARASTVRVAPSPGAPDSNGILRRPRRPRVHKREPEHRSRGSRPSPSERSGMRFVGIDVASEQHVVAGVDETGAVGLKPTAFTEDAEGYDRLLGLLGAPADTLVALEATGHYCSPRASPSPCSTPSARGASRGRSSSGPRPTRSTRSASHASPRKSARRQPACPTR
jgi:hypothetical protein